MVTTFAIEEFEEIEDSVANTVLIRGSDTSVRVQAESGKISVVHFEQEGNNNTQEDFGDDNTEVLSFQVESLQERSSSGKFVLKRIPTEIQIWNQATKTPNWSKCISFLCFAKLQRESKLRTGPIC